jgi:hypothetical protein
VDTAISSSDEELVSLQKSKIKTDKIQKAVIKKANKFMCSSDENLDENKMISQTSKINNKCSKIANSKKRNNSIKSEEKDMIDLLTAAKEKKIKIGFMPIFF